MSGSIDNNSVGDNNDDSSNTITNLYNTYSTFNIDNTSGNITVINEAQGRSRDLQSMPGIENKLQDISKRLKDAERLEILSWLSEVNYKEHHKFIASARQANTGNWLFQKQNFIEWEKSSSSIFWLHGIDKFLRELELVRLCLQPRSILNTVFKQLSLMSPEGFLPEAVISLYQEKKRQVVKYLTRGLWLEQSTELILQLSRAFEQTVIIVDALDECNKETRCQLLDALAGVRPEKT
ncbi:hypothetical protein RUND412_006024 [Rhizina undulata]